MGIVILLQATFIIFIMHFTLSIIQALYMKLFFLLGILWSCESIHAILHNDETEKCHLSSLEIFFRIIDSFNLLRGFFIFLIFICKKTVLTKMKCYYMQKSGQSASARGRINKQAQVKFQLIHRQMCGQDYSCFHPVLRFC